MIKEILNVARWQNMLMAFACMIVVKIFIINYFYNALGFTSLISTGEFVLFCVAVLLVMFGSDTMNLYYSENNCNINKSLIVSSFVVPDAVAVITGYIVGYSNGFVHLGSIMLLFVFSSYFYAIRYQSRRIYGGIIVSLFCAMLVLLPGLFELFSLISKPDLFRIIVPEIKDISVVFLFFATFIFLLALTDTALKYQQEAQEFEQGRKTPIYLLSIILMFTVIFFQYRYYSASPVKILGLVSALVHLPLVYFIYELRKAISEEDYAFLSSLVKILFVSILFAMTTVKYIIIGGIG